MKTEELIKKQQQLFHILIDFEESKIKITEAHDKICSLFNVEEIGNSFPPEKRTYEDGVKAYEDEKFREDILYKM